MGRRDGSAGDADAAVRGETLLPVRSCVMPVLPAVGCGPWAVGCRGGDWGGAAFPVGTVRGRGGGAIGFGSAWVGAR